MKWGDFFVMCQGLRRLKEFSRTLHRRTLRKTDNRRSIKFGSVKVYTVRDCRKMDGRCACAGWNASVWLWLSIVMLVCCGSSGFQIKEKACGGEGMPSRSYLPEMFRRALLPDLIVNTPSNCSIYSISFASGTDRVYGAALCNGTTLGACETCHGCLSFLKDHVLQYCSASTQVLIWAHECFLHFDIGPFDIISLN